MSPAGWAADGRGGCRWSITGEPHDIAEYRGDRVSAAERPACASGHRQVYGWRPGDRCNQCVTEASRASPEIESDPVLEELKHAAWYFDAGHVHQQGKLRPSQIMTLRYFVLVTTAHDRALDEAIRLARSWLTVGRRRWRQGWSANPLTPEPLPRRISSNPPAGAPAPSNGAGAPIPERNSETTHV